MDEMMQAPDFAPVAAGTQVVQEVTRVPERTVPSQGSFTFQTQWTRPMKLIELQTCPGFMVEEVRVGQKLFATSLACEGERVEANVPVTVKVLNPQLMPGQFSGAWFTEGLGEAPAVKPSPAPTEERIAGSTTHDAAAPRGAVSSPMTFVEQSYAAPPAPPPVPESHTIAQTQVGVGGQQFIHVGGQFPARANTPVGHGHVPGTVEAREGEMLLLMTRERAQKIAFILKGGILMPQETPALVYPIEQSIQMAQTRAVPGVNEIAVSVTRAQADRIVAMVKGTDWQEIQGLILKFEGKA